MINSMTAFARSEQQYPWGSAVWEIKSVNHRYLEPAFRLPEDFRFLEFKLRDQLKSQIRRGKVDCSLKLDRQGDTAAALQVNSAQLEALLDACGRVQRQAGEWSALNPLDVLAWPGLLTESNTVTDSMTDELCTQLDFALQQLTASRKREGSQLADYVSRHLKSIDQLLREARTELPSILQAQREQLHQRLSEITAQVDQQRLEQELVYLAQKADVEEELERLETHSQEVTRILRTGGACGRRLDFLMQEFNREANTLSSKSISPITTRIAVELKVLTEQMREQIQNIE